MQAQTIQEEKWVVIGKKGVITLPKTLRTEAGMAVGSIAKAKLVGKTIVIEPREEVGYRLFSKEEIEQWKKEDKLPPEMEKELADYWDEIGLP